MTRNTPSQTIPKFTPRQHLNSQETVLFDTRPHFIAVVGLGRVIWFFIGSLLVPLIAAGIAAGVRKAPFWYVLFSWFLLVLLPLLIRAMKWRNVFYSLTDQRIMRGHGVINKSFNAQQLTRIGGLLDTSTYRITGVTFGQGLSGRIFNFGNIIFQTNHENISWLGIKDPLNVRRLIEEKVATFQNLGANQATYNEAVIRKVAEVRTEASFGLVGPKHDVSIQDKVGGGKFAPDFSCIPLLLQLRTAEPRGSCFLLSMRSAASLNLDNHQTGLMNPCNRGSIASISIFVA